MNHPVTLEHLKHLPSLDALPQPAPDLLLLEASWGAQHELGLIRQLRERHPHLRCILNVFDGKAGLAAAVRQAGGAGVFNKAFRTPCWCRCVCKVLQEDCFIPTAIGEGRAVACQSCPNLTPPVSRKSSGWWLRAIQQTDCPPAVSGGGHHQESAVQHVPRAGCIQPYRSITLVAAHCAVRAANKTLLALLPDLAVLPVLSTVAPSQDCCAGFC